MMYVAIAQVEIHQNQARTVPVSWLWLFPSHPHCLCISHEPRCYWKERNENYHNWTILVKCSFFRRILIWKKHMWMLFGPIKHTQNTRKHTSHQCWCRMYHFSEISIIKHIWGILRFVMNHKHSGFQDKLYTEYRKIYQSSMLIQNVPSLRIFNHKTYLSYS